MLTRLMVFLVFAVVTVNTGRGQNETGPVQRWVFGEGSVAGAELKAEVGGLNGEILGAFEMADDGGISCLKLSPKGGEGGILLTRDREKAGLPTGAMTAEAWVKLDSTLEWGGIVGAIYDTGNNEAGWVMGYRRDRFYFGLAAEEKRPITYLNAGAPFVLDAWYHVAVSYDGKGEMRLYVDGKLSAKSDVQRGAIPVPDPLYYVIGAYRDDDNYFPIDGRLAEVSVWHRGLGAEEIGARFEKRKSGFPGSEPGEAKWPGGGDGWVTWMGDNGRTGRAPRDVELHASGNPEWVYDPGVAPAAAWPEVAKSDHWRKRSTPETPKLTFDWVHDVVVAEGRVYFGSSADDGVRCLDAETGERLWIFYAGGPVRLAPTLADGRVVFGCDDGCVYALDAAEGKLLWKSRPSSMGDRRLPGNGRLMSVWPVRTGILVKGDTGYFGAGLFPDEGTFYCSVDLRDGKILDEKPVDFSPQGFISEDGGRLLAEAGRMKSGGQFGTVRARKPVARQEARISNSARGRFPFALVETPSLVFAGGEGKVAAFEPGKDKAVWEAEVEGAARGMAIAGGRLFVSTTTGKIYAFGANASGGERGEGPAEKAEGGDAEVERAVSLLARKKGYALVVGVGDGSLIRGLVAETDLHVVGVDMDSGRIGGLRAEMGKEGIYGERVALQEVVDYGALPFVDGIFNLIQAGDATVLISDSEAERLVRPWDGVAMLGNGGLVRGEAPEGAGSWTHAYGDVGNSASSDDRLVDGATRLRWFGRPGPEHIVDRHLRAPPPLAAGGYLFVPGRDYLFGLDGHNGTVLWEREIAGFMRASMLRDCGNLAFDPGAKRLFASAGAQCLLIDADSGETLREIGLEVAEDEWGYLAISGGVLVGSSVERGGVRRELSYGAIFEGGYADGKRPVCSRSLFGIDPESGERKWVYRPGGAIVNPTLCIGDGRLLFLESKNGETFKDGGGGRFSYADLIGKAGAEVVALDLKTGDEVWRRKFEEWEEGMQTLFFSCSEGKLVMVDSRNTTAEAAPGKTLHYHVRVAETETGKESWKALFNTGRRANLIHGEQDLHPVIAGGRLVVEPVVFDLKTGEELFRFKRKGGGGCGTISASSTKLFFRAGNPAQFDLETKEQAWVSKTTRPGCWINMIPADGMLLVPEGSSGCICGFPVQASMAYATEAQEKPETPDEE